MDADYIELVIEEELEKMNVNLSDSDSEYYTDTEENFTKTDEKISIPDSVLTYVDASNNRLNTFEQLILEDVDEDENGATCTEPNRVLICDDPNELTSTSGEDSTKLKEVILSEFEEQAAGLSEVDQTCSDKSTAHTNDDQTECDSYKECERQFIFKWRELEERLRKEEEQRIAQLEVEKERNLSSMREQEEERRRRHEELRKMEKVSLFGNIKASEEDCETNEGLSLELIKQKELIERLEEQLLEERHMFEKAQQEDKRRTMEQHSRAATTLQAALRGSWARRWCRGELVKRREEERMEQEERGRRREREERLKRELEEEIKRVVEEEQRRREEMEMRRAEYERAKERERHRLEKQREVEEQRQKEEEEQAKTENERKTKDEQEKRRMEEERAEEERREVQKEVKKRKEKRRQEEEKKVVEVQIKRANESEPMREVERRKQEKRERSKGEKGEVIKSSEEKDGQTSQGKSQKEETRISITKEHEKGANELIEQRGSPKTSHRDRKKNPDMLEEERKGEFVSQPCLPEISKRNPLTHPSPSSSGYQKHNISSADLTASTHNITTVRGDLHRTCLENKVVGGISEMNTRGPQCATVEVFDPSVKEPNSCCLPDITEQKRLAWMLSCTPWSKLSMQNRRKRPSAPARRRAPRRASRSSLPPLPLDTVLKCGPWSSLNQVTTVTLEDLPGCSLSTLSECSRLQSLTLRRCGLQALDGLHHCGELKHVDVQDNSIAYVDCAGLARLEVLLLGRNQLTNVHGMEGATNLTVLQLSHNAISRLGGLGSLKKLQRLSVDHNQLISTRGLGDIVTLLYLDCSYNHLSRAEGLENCALLNTLDLRGNSLTELPELSNHVLLRALYADENSVSCVQGLGFSWLPLLRRLSLGHNSITQLPLLMDLLSLKTLDVSHNCLSELRSVCQSLQGCSSLLELDLTDNPLLQESTWRSSVLAIKPNLIKLNGELTGASAVPSVGSTQMYSFQAICQAHQDQLDSVLQKQSMAISSAPSTLEAQLMVGDHSAALFQLAEEQRYAHEYGDGSVCEPARNEPAVSGCLQACANTEQNPGTLTQRTVEPHTQNSSEPHAQRTAEPHTQNSAVPHTQRTSQPHTQNSAEPHTLRASQPHIQNSAEPHTQRTSQPHTQNSAEPHTQRTSQPHTQNSAEPHTQRTSQPHTQNSAEPHTQRTSQPHSQNSAEPHTQRTSQPHTQNSVEPHTLRASQPHTQNSVEPHTQNQAEPHIQNSTEPHIHNSAEPHTQNQAEPHIQNSAVPHTQSPTETHTQSLLEPYLSGSALNTHPSSADQPAVFAGGSMNQSQRLREPRKGSTCADEHSRAQQLKTMAAAVIQCWWRTCRQRRHTGLNPFRIVCASKKRSEPFNKHDAAAVIQAVWRGYSLRRRLSQALALVRSTPPDRDILEEVDMAEFIYAEEVMEMDQMTLHSEVSLGRALPYLGRLLMSKPPPSYGAELHKSASVLPWKPREAWAGSKSVTQRSESPDPNPRYMSPALTPRLTAMTERSEKIFEEWYSPAACC